MNKIIGPAIILVRPQMGENIGAAARVMKNFGLSELRIVAPRDGWPNPRAVSLAAGAGDVIEAAQVFSSLEEAVADCHMVYATSARNRFLNLPHDDVRNAMNGAAQQAGAEVQIALLFGPENNGLSNEDLAQCNQLVSIPVSTEYGSLNLSQAVGILCYEWRMAQDQPGENQDVPAMPASKEQLQALFNRLEKELDARDFWRVAEKKPHMWTNIRLFLQRATLTEQETRTLHGIIAALSQPIEPS